MPYLRPRPKARLSGRPPTEGVVAVPGDAVVLRLVADVGPARICFYRRRRSRRSNRRVLGDLGVRAEVQRARQPLHALKTPPRMGVSGGGRGCRLQGPRGERQQLKSLFSYLRMGGGRRDFCGSAHL